MKSLMIAVLLLAFASVAMAQDEVQPPPIGTLTINTGKTTAVVSWTSIGDACTGNTLAQYDVRWSSSAITECNFTSATQFQSIPSPSPSGNTDCADFNGATGVLNCNTTYYFAVKVKDSAGNWSDITTG